MSSRIFALFIFLLIILVGITGMMISRAVAQDLLARVQVSAIPSQPGSMALLVSLPEIESNLFAYRAGAPDRPTAVCFALVSPGGWAEACVFGANLEDGEIFEPTVPINGRFTYFMKMPRKLVGEGARGGISGFFRGILNLELNTEDAAKVFDDLVHSMDVNCVFGGNENGSGLTASCY